MFIEGVGYSPPPSPGTPRFRDEDDLGDIGEETVSGEEPEEVVKAVELTLCSVSTRGEVRGDAPGIVIRGSLRYLIL
jgi:hypothetical protein